MSDEQVTVPRVCQCGKPANHPGICRTTRIPVGLPPDPEAERVDANSEDLFAERRAERHAKRQPGFRADRHTARRALSDHQSHDLMDARVVKLSTVAAGNSERSAAGSGHPSKNLALERRGAQMLDDDPRWDGTMKTLRRALDRAHELLDEYEGLGVATADPEITPEAKDAAIVDPANEHLSNVEFAQQNPGYGSPGTIGRKRRWFKLGLCTMNGLTPRSKCHCPTCRGAVV